MIGKQVITNITWHICGNESCMNGVFGTYFRCGACWEKFTGSSQFPTYPINFPIAAQTVDPVYDNWKKGFLRTMRPMKI